MYMYVMPVYLSTGETVNGLQSYKITPVRISLTVLDV